MDALTVGYLVGTYSVIEKFRYFKVPNKGPFVSTDRWMTDRLWYEINIPFFSKEKSRYNHSKIRTAQFEILLRCHNVVI